MKNVINIYWVLLISVVTAFPHNAQAQGGWDDALGTLTDLAEQFEIGTDLIRPPTPQEWQQFWQAINGALQSESLDHLAGLLPYARVAITYLDRHPEARPYADWLRQRMDYLTMAAEILDEEKTPVKEVPAPATPGSVPPPVKPAPVPPPSRPVTIVPPPKPTTPPATPKPVPSVPVQPAKPARSDTASQKSMDMNRWVKRMESRPAPKAAGQYVPLLKPIFKQEGVPEQLVWLAEVESSFDPQARSPVGALGLYQFMPATAERFGLTLKPKDERIMPERSAAAAAKYLKFLHGRFNSWPLALAAYNAGEGRVGKLLVKHNAKTFEDIAEHLPAETRMYVPKVAAVVKVREGADLTRL